MPEIKVVALIQMDAACAECGEILEATYDDSSETVYAEPCKKCIETAEKGGYDQGEKDTMERPEYHAKD